jgi:integrative and conjugative element protein (TIGR02256 family)
MHYVGDWVSQDKRRLVVFAADVLQLFKSHRQRFACQREAGGVLLGHRRGSHLEVVLATPPMSKDRRFEYLFEREPDGHAEAAVQAWEQAGNTIDYVGEWHTHPQRVPTPSPLDRKEWRKLGVKYAPKPLLVVVVGTSALHVEVLLGASQAALLPMTD